VLIKADSQQLSDAGGDGSLETTHARRAVCTCCGYAVLCAHRRKFGNFAFYLIVVQIHTHQNMVYHVVVDKRLECRECVKNAPESISSGTSAPISMTSSSATELSLATMSISSLSDLSSLVSEFPLTLVQHYNGI